MAGQSKSSIPEEDRELVESFMHSLFLGSAPPPDPTGWGSFSKFAQTVWLPLFVIFLLIGVATVSLLAYNEVSRTIGLRGEQTTTIVKEGIPPGVHVFDVGDLRCVAIVPSAIDCIELTVTPTE